MRHIAVQVVLQIPAKQLQLPIVALPQHIKLLRPGIGLLQQRQQNQ